MVEAVSIGHAKHVLLAVMVLFLSDACASGPIAEDPIACTEGNCVQTPYRIGPGDVLEVSVWKDQNLDRTVPVRPDGMISFPLLNDVQAAGLTPMQLRDTLTEKLKQYVSMPEVAVVVREIHSFTVSVLGQVKNPGRYEFKSATTVLDALATAGGLSEFASPSDIVVLRENAKGRIRIPFDYSGVVKRANRTEILALQPGDVVVVP